jgi:hypothetical protein
VSRREQKAMRRHDFKQAPMQCSLVAVDQFTITRTPAVKRLRGTAGGRGHGVRRQVWGHVHFRFGVQHGHESLKAYYPCGDLKCAPSS